MKWARITAMTSAALLAPLTPCSWPVTDEQRAGDQQLLAEAQELGHSGALRNTQKLIELLANPGTEVRVGAAEALGELLHDYGYRGHDVTSPGENLPELLESVGQHAKQITLSPVRALEVAGFRTALIDAAGDPQAPVRAAAIHALERIFASDDPKAPPQSVKAAIGPHVKDADPSVILPSMRAAYFLHIEQSRADILSNLGHENASVRASAAQALALMGFTEAALPISRLLTDRDPEVRRSGARELLFLCSLTPCDPAIGSALLSALPNKELRSDVARTIVVTKIPEARQPLLSALQEDSGWGLADFVDIHKKTVEFLGLDIPTQIDMLGFQLRHGPPSVQERSATALASLHDQRALPLLLAALQSTDNGVLAAVMRALPDVTREVGDGSALERLQVIASLPDSRLVEALQQQVPRFTDRKMFGIALGILRNPAITVDQGCSLLPSVCQGRWELTVHPNLFESREVLREKLGRLESGEADAKMAISSALVLAGATEAVHPMLLLLKDPNRNIRSHAADVVFWMCVDGLCDNRAVPPLVEALGDKVTRGNAARTLAYLGDRETVPVVLTALQEDVPDDSMGLVKYWQADLKNLADFVGKDDFMKLLHLYSAGGNPESQRKAKQVLSEIAGE
jgi:HEAT repeat protein